MEKNKKMMERITYDYFDFDIFLEMADYIVKTLNLENYIKETKFVDLSENSNLGEYNGNSILIDNKNIDITNVSKTISYLEILFHEIEHAKQERIIDKFKNMSREELFNQSSEDILRRYIYAKSYQLIDMYPREYNENHDLFPIEHEANYYGLLNTIRFMYETIPYLACIYYPTRHSKNILRAELLKGYKKKLLSIESPIERISINKQDYIPTEKMINKAELTDFNRLVLGLPISKKKFNEVSNLSYDKIKIKK